MSKTEPANTATDAPAQPPAVGALLERGVGRLEPKRADDGDAWAWEECEDWLDDDPVCQHCQGDGTDPMCDHLLPCPACQGEQRP